MDRLEISAAEHQARMEALREVMQGEGYDLMCVFGPVRVSYLTGFHFAATERPIVLAIPLSGEPAMLVPRLELEHVSQQCPWFGDVRSYPEYPGGGSGRHPMLHLKDLLDTFRVPRDRIGADLDGYENRWGYRGPSLGQVLGSTVVPRLELIDDLRSVKSVAEIALIEEACRWGDRAHGSLVAAIEVGVDEVAVSNAVTMAATAEMLAELGDRFVPKAREGHPANAMFIRGANTANPHGLHRTGGVQDGDVLVTGAYGVVGGYESELERTMVMMTATDAFAHYFEAMLATQDVAFEAIRPGRACSDVEADVRAFVWGELGMGDLYRHHTGHAFGLEGHEHPFLDLDDATILREGMILSVEPGLYVPGLGGFRHSDTVVVTATGNRRLSRFPRTLDALIVPGR